MNEYVISLYSQQEFNGSNLAEIAVVPETIT